MKHGHTRCPFRESGRRSERERHRERDRQRDRERERQIKRERERKRGILSLYPFTLTQRDIQVTEAKSFFYRSTIPKKKRILKPFTITIEKSPIPKPYFDASATKFRRFRNQNPTRFRNQKKTIPKPKKDDSATKKRRFCNQKRALLQPTTAHFGNQDPCSFATKIRAVWNKATLQMQEGEVGWRY